MSKRKFIIVFLAMILLIGVVFFYLSKENHRSKKDDTSFIDRPGKTQQVMSSESDSKLVSESQASSSSRNDLTAPSDNKASTNQETTGAEFVKNAVTNYLTITLEPQALDARQAKLEKEFSSGLLASCYVTQTTTQLKALLETYQKTQAVDTNSSVRLNDVSVSKVDVFQNVTDDSIYYVEVLYTEKPINSDATFSFQERLTVTYKDQQLTTLEVVESKAANK